MRRWWVSSKWWEVMKTSSGSILWLRKTQHMLDSLSHQGTPRIILTWISTISTSLVIIAVKMTFQATKAQLPRHTREASQDGRARGEGWKRKLRKSRPLHNTLASEYKFDIILFSPWKVPLAQMKQDLEADYLAAFKKTVAQHEAFLKRLASHSKFR